MALSAAQDINNIGGSVVANVAIVAGQSTSNTDLKQSISDNGLLGSSSMEQRKQSSSTQAIASNVSGKNITITSNNNLSVKGSNVNAVQNATLVAGNNVSIDAAQNSQTNSSFYKKSETNFSVDVTNGPGVTTSQASQNGKSSTTTDVGSTIRSGANLTVVAGNSIGGTAATLQAGGTANLSAQGNIVLQEGRTTYLADLQQKRNDQYIFSGTETQRRATQDTSTALASRVSGTQGVTLQANQGTLYLSDVKVDSAGNVTLRGADVILTSALNSTSQTFEEKTSRSGATINDVMATFQAGDGLGHERKDTVDDAHTTLAQGSVSGQNVNITSTGGANSQLALRAVEVSATGTPATPGTITLDAGAGTVKLQTIQTSDSHAVSMTESDIAWQGKSGSGHQTQSTADTQLNGQLSTTAGRVQVSVQRRQIDSFSGRSRTWAKRWGRCSGVQITCKVVRKSSRLRCWWVARRSVRGFW